jgi:hypothetical protein
MYALNKRTEKIMSEVLTFFCPLLISAISDSPEFGGARMLQPLYGRISLRSMANVAPDEYICLFESDPMTCSDYETATMVMRAGVVRD